MSSSRHLRPAVAASVVLAVSACATPPGDGWRGSIEEHDGVTFVHNPADSPVREDGTPPLVLHLEQTFGVEEEPEDALLSFVTGAAVDDAGNVYVVDRGDDRVVAFAPDGSVLWSGGRTGERPGEFQGENGIAWDGDSRTTTRTPSGP